MFFSALLESQLYGVERLDPATFAGAAVVMFAAAVFATNWPARRAAYRDPIHALRYE